MEQFTELTPPLLAAPRHLRRRRFHTDIPDMLLVADGEPYMEPAPSAEPAASKRAAVTAPPAEAAYRRKRLVALLLVLAVAVSVPGLVIALVLAG